ncbi:MAG: tRNA lysidine(34) synthetase TilS [Planctomycetota bacterium]
MPNDGPADPQYHPAVKSLARGLRQRCRVQTADAIVVGCSGGADSVALLRALLLLAPRRNWRLRIIVAHINHQLRGQASEDDADFVGALAATHGCAYERRDIRPADEPDNLEAACRWLRYRALCDIAQHHGASLVATGHHADDQLETLLMRVLRGAGPRGLRGIAWRRRLKHDLSSLNIHAIRPMLATPRDALRDLLEQIGQPWREDASNRDLTRVRARLRHEIIPLLKQIKHDAADRAVHLTQQFVHVHQLVQEQADAVQTTPDSSGESRDVLPREEARRLNPIVLTQVLRRDLIKLGVPADKLPGRALHPVVTAAKDREGGERNFDFANGTRIQITAQEVRVTQG